MSERVHSCRQRTQAVKDALRIYVLETKNDFSTVAGRGVYGESPVQGQLSKMYEAGFAPNANLAFDVQLADVR